MLRLVLVFFSLPEGGIRILFISGLLLLDGSPEHFAGLLPLIVLTSLVNTQSSSFFFFSLPRAELWVVFIEFFLLCGHWPIFTSRYFFDMFSKGYHFYCHFKEMNLLVKY